MTGNVTVAPAGVLVRGAAGELGRPRRVKAVDPELPGEQTLEGRDGLGRRSLVDERAHDGDAGAAGVEAVHVCADDAAGDAAVAAFVDGPEAVDEEVVGDVVPVQALGVVGVDAADQRGRVGAGVEVAARGVVHERHLDRCVGRRRVAQRLVGAPLRTGDDDGSGRRGRGRRVEGHAGHRGGEPAGGAGDARGDAAVLGGVDGHEPHAVERRGPGVAGGDGRDLDVAGRLRSTRRR